MNAVQGIPTKMGRVQSAEGVSQGLRGYWGTRGIWGSGQFV